MYILNTLRIANKNDLWHNTQTSVPGSNNFAATEIWYCLHMAWFIHNVQGQNTHFHWRIAEIVCCGKLWLVIIQLRCWRDYTAKRRAYVMFSHAASIVVRLRNVRFNWSMDLSNLTVFFVLIRIIELRTQLIQNCVLKY